MAGRRTGPVPRSCWPRGGGGNIRRRRWNSTAEPRPVAATRFMVGTRRLEMAEHTRSGRGVLRWLVPAPLVVGRLARGGLLGPYTGKLAEVQTNDSAAFLPADAESTRVAELQRSLSGQESVPAIAVFVFDGGVGEAELAAVAELAGEVAQLEGVVGEPSPPIPSDD